MATAVKRLLSYRIRKKAARLGIRYQFVFMRASAEQLDKISLLIESGAIRPIVDRIFPFDSTADALAHV
ncbi:zinc-binding dehydrogenase [Symbiopectobacterium purcellii]|uniref:zinc-binding dehydrogenase n=1 Tax=Symbiopectobacterium purcellii TaxID=2871826 RepID=UPI003F8797CA